MHRVSSSLLHRRCWTLFSLSTAAAAAVCAFSPSSCSNATRDFAAKRTTTTMSSAAAHNHNFVNGPPMTIGLKKDFHLPTMIVFDLDDCLWTPEMHELPRRPSVPVHGDLGNGETGVVGLSCGDGKRSSATVVQLYPGARQALYRLATDPAYHGVLLAAASTSLEPSYSDTCLKHLEILPNLTVDQMLSFRQIGRTGRLNADKRTHFQLLHQESGVPYEEMLFFDDDNWGPHTRTVYDAYGVIGQRTPNGITLREFEFGLELYRRHVEKVAAK